MAPLTRSRTCGPRGCSSMVEPQSSKLATRVRFPSSALTPLVASQETEHSLHQRDARILVRLDLLHEHRGVDRQLFAAEQLLGEVHNGGRRILVLLDLLQEQRKHLLPHVDVQAGHAVLLLEQPAEGAEIDVEVVDGEPEVVSQLVHLLLEKHQRRPEPFYFVIGEPARLHPSYGLLLHELPQQLHEGEHELDQALLDLLGVGADSTAQPGYVDVRSVRLERPYGGGGDSGCSRTVPLVRVVGHDATSEELKLNGGHGPVAHAARPGSSACHSSRAAHRSVTRPCGSSTASRSPSVVRSSRSSLARSPTASVNAETSWSCSRTRATRLMTYSRPVSGGSGAGVAGLSACTTISTLLRTAPSRSSHSASRSATRPSRASRSSTTVPNRKGSSAPVAESLATISPKRTSSACSGGGGPWTSENATPTSVPSTRLIPSGTIAPTGSTAYRSSPSHRPRGVLRRTEPATSCAGASTSRSPR